MMSRLFLSAALAVAFLGTALQADAAPRRRVQNYDARSHGFYVWGGPEIGYRPIGGHAYFSLYSAWPFINGSAYNYPGYYNNQTFWERVQTQANYPVQY